MFKQVQVKTTTISPEER